MNSSLTRFVIAACTACVVAGNAAAGVFSVSPVRIFMAPKDRAVAVTVNNDGDEELVMQADVYEWRQKAGGEDELQLTEDLVLNPPVLRIAPHSRQVVRLALLRPRPAAEQLTYRLVVREVPEARSPGKSLQLQIALAFSLPVFVTPPSAKAQLACSAARSAPDSVRVACENTGTAYAQPREVALASTKGEALGAREASGYILPGVRRTYDIKRTGARIEPGAAKITLQLDDGSTQHFDANIGD